MILGLINPGAIFVKDKDHVYFAEMDTYQIEGYPILSYYYRYPAKKICNSCLGQPSDTHLSVGPATVHTTTTSRRFLNMSGWSNSAISVCRHTAHIVGWIKSSVKASAEKWFRLIGLTKTACVRTAQRCSETVLLNGIHAVIAGR